MDRDSQLAEQGLVELRDGNHFLQMTVMGPFYSSQ